MSERVAELEKALRDLLMERSLYTEVAARRALGICPACGRGDDPCSMCLDESNERERERHDDEHL